MKNEKKKLTTPEQGGPSFDESKDFKFVQLDKSIHDTKFETKPTTYFKDAFKRFCKSKSSVTAAVILGVLILMSIFVPVFDGNSIAKANAETVLLPPKWFDDANGFMDGTGYVENVVLGDDGLPALNNGVQDYLPSAIRGDITVSSTSFSDTVSPNVLTYGQGGQVAFALSSGSDEATFTSPALSIGNGETLGITYVTDGVDRPGLEVRVYVSLGTGDDFQEIDLSFQNEGNSYSAEWTNSTNENSIYVNFETRGNDLYLESLSLTDEGEEIMLRDSSFEYTIPAGFASGSARTFIYNNLVDESNSVPDSSSWTASGGGFAIKNIVVRTGSFRYDYYAGAYGEDSHEFTQAELNDFVAKGYIEPTFHFVVDPSTASNGEWSRTDEEMGFKLTELGETYCPLRQVTAERFSTFTNSNGTTRSLSVVGVRSRYRDFYYNGYIAECAPVNFFLGTNNNGVDFFKFLFSGLLTSLELGALASIINIFIGVIWGSISGYFGGYVDLLMERITEILGGMPWIVMMTLIVLLLGSNFWTFLFALCLTGWMGTSSTTRAQFYRFKGREYVLAARTLGASDARLIFRHILPNGIGTIITGAALMIPSVIFQEATISYLLPNILAFQGTSFGVTLSNAQNYIYTAPYLIVSGSIVMAIIMICFNLFGNGLRDAFNPSLKGGNE